MLESEESGAVTPGIPADAPVQRGGAAQRVVPLAFPGAVPPNLPGDQSLALSVRLVVARLR